MRTLVESAAVAEQSWEIAWRRAEIPAAGGHGNARSVATVQSALACGGVTNGVRLLSEAGCEAALEEVCYTPDLVLGVPLRFGMGYGLNSPDTPLSPNPRTCFWGGWGGSLVVVDLDARMCRRVCDEQDGRGNARRLSGRRHRVRGVRAVGAL